MEPEVVKRRGRKRKRKDEEGVDKTVAKKKAVGVKSRVLIGRYVKKEFDDSGEFLGKIVSYETGLYRVDYEDGDCEDLKTKEVKGIIVEDNEMDAAFYKRKKSLDAIISKKYANKAETTKNKVENVRSDSVVVDNGVELVNAEKVETSVHGVAFEVNGAQTEVDNESTSDFSDYEPPCEVVEVDRPVVPPPELPPSSRVFGVSEEHVSYLLSVYSFLRSFSVCLFLSPFGLDEFVGALNSSFHNTLLDAIHVALIRALKSNVENLSSEGSELASKCLRIMDWSLLDSLTWPVFIVQYLTTMRYAEGPEWKEFYVNVLERDYYTLSAGKKLTVLQLLCDDALNSAEVRAEIDTRETSEVGPDPDGVPVINNEIVPVPVRRRGRPPKIPLSNDQETVKNNSEINIKTPSSTANPSVSNATGLSNTGGDDDDDNEDGNGDECRLCGMDGTLICCDGCPSSYHSRCIGVMKMFIPEGEWYCPECTINRRGPNVTKTTSLRGAEFFGIDPYEQVFLGSCDHLLVMKASRSSDLHIQYYSPFDIQKVLYTLTCSPEYTALYLDICKGILQYWEIPEHIFSLPNPIGIEVKEIGNAPDVVTAGNINGIAENESKDVVGAENCKELGFSQASLDLSAICIAENGNGNNRSNTSNVCDLSNLPSHKKEVNLSIRSYEEKVYMGSSFKPQAYLNVYIHGDFAASAGASLAILSSEEKLGSQSHPSSNHRKFMSANYSLQAKAFSLAAKRFYWPNYVKKLVEVSRERCGWCLSCKSSINSKRGCLLNAAASNAIKGAVKILVSLPPSKNIEGSLASIATYIMFMEESLCGLTVGPFLNRSYRNQWQKQVEEAATLGEIKAYLLEFERNIRDIAFSVDWIRLVDDVGLENQVIQSAKSVVGSIQKRGPSRRGRKRAIIIPEITESDGKNASTDVAWWRGGMLSKHIFQKGTLPQMLIKHAARQGGCGKINGVQYVDGLEIPKRSRQFLWRAAVDIIKTASQLALQVRYLDLHVRWNELLSPEQPLQDGKGIEAEASAFRNACIVDKKILGNKVSYGVIFENQKHIPSRVLKKVLEVEETGDKKEKNWFLEMQIPLYLIKEYEVVVGEVNLSNAVKHVTILSGLSKKQLKTSGKNVFSFLEQKRDNKGNCFCTFCQRDVPFRISTKCSACQGYCHEQCAVGTNIQTAARVEFLITCKRCYIDKDITLKNEIVGDSPTSPLLLQGQESQHSQTAFKQGKQNRYEKPFDYSNQSSQKKIPTSNQPKKSKSGKKSQSEKKPKPYNSSMGSKKKNGKSGKLVLGLIWKKRNQNDTGIDFRLNNILLKDNPNGRLLAPICHLCTQPYNADLMYIRCEKCQNWFHADSAELEESKVRELFGFKCCRCRRIRIPICLYTDSDTRMKLESKKEAMAKLQKQKIYGSDYDSDSNSDENEEQLIDWDLDSEEGGNIQEESQLYSFPEVNDDEQLEVDSGPGFGPGSGPKKLPVRRHLKPENESDVGFEIPNVNPVEESLAAVVEWDVSNNGDGDNMMFDCEDFNYEDMEFEPQTYFSFNELLASDENVRGDPPMVNPEPYQMGITYDQQEPMFSVENELDMAPCNVCCQTDPIPDLFCMSCNLWIHQCCSPWEEDSSWEPETGWKCGQCRTWS